MRRQELVAAIDTVLAAVSSSSVLNVAPILHSDLSGEAVNRRERKASRAVQELLISHQKYVIAANKFGPVEKEIVQIFNLGRLDDPSFWASLVELETPEPLMYLESLQWRVKQLAGLRSLVAPEEIETSPSEDPALRLERFLVIVIEEGAHFSRPERLINVLQGTSLLYEAHAVLLSLPEDSLLVAACDSGSDKAFDFLGIAAAIQALKETVIALWDRVFFFRERKLLVSVKLVAEALPVLSEISALAEKKTIGPEQAEILRRKVIDGATQLVEAGAISPDFAMLGGRDFRVLVGPEPKLLAAPQPGTPNEAPQPRLRSKKTKKR